MYHICAILLAKPASGSHGSFHLRRKNKNYLFYNGVCTDTLSLDEVPCFNVLILNENERVGVKATTRGEVKDYYFVNPIYDNVSVKATRSQILSSSQIGQRAISAYSYFYSPDGGPFSYEFQRDYIYYGITPENNSGTLIGSTSEYINYIEVDPRMYARIADQDEDARLTGKTTATREKRPYTESELLAKFWTKGSYCFHIVVSTSTQSNAFDIPIVAAPSDLWDFNIHTWKSQHKTAFRHSKYTSKICLEDFTPKPYYISNDRLISLGKWDISKESLERYVSVYEWDESESIDSTSTYEFTDVVSQSIDGKLSGSYSWEKKASVSGEVNYNWKDVETTKKTHTVSIKVTKKSDNLGCTTIYYNDPIIEKSISNDQYQMHTYSIGGFTFGITAF